MPCFSHEKKQYFKSRIRAELSHDHTISGELAVYLKQGGLELERHYLGKLLKRSAFASHGFEAEKYRLLRGP